MTMLQLRLNFDLQWELMLNPRAENNPYVHVYLSTHFADTPQVLKLGSARGTRTVQLDYALNQLAPGLSSDNGAASLLLLANCDLNFDFFVLTQNDSEEAVCNPAGCIIVPLREVAWPAAVGADPREKPPMLRADVHLYMVEDPALQSKGSLLLRPAAGGEAAPTITLAGQPLIASMLSAEAFRHAQQRHEKALAVCQSMTDMCKELFGYLRPTLPTVANINSDIWCSRAGNLPPLAYTIDLVRPRISEAFYLRCMDVVLRRSGKEPRQVLALLMDERRQDAETMGALCGQMMCTYVIHTTYRRDFVWTYDSRIKQYDQLATEAFGDISVEHGAGYVLVYMRAVGVIV